MKADHRAALLRRKRFSPGIFSVTFEAPDLARAVAPGQFAMLEVPGQIRPYLRRAYSIADVALSRGEVEFLVKTIGPGTRALEELSEGAEVRLLGPLGNGFSWEDLEPGREVAIVAGGIGAAPFPFLMRALAEAKLRVDLFLGGRRAPDLSFRDRLEGSAGSRVILATEDGSLGERGFVTEVFRATARKRSAAYARVFACGPMAMFSALAPIAAELGIPAEFSTEADMGCGFGVCLGCVIPAKDKPFLVSCVEGPILPPERIAWERLR
ncbi:MAG TPA: dihydroorotate dehydrogenase electron transfer subunit [Thermoanaerobaculia bacterium]